MKTITFHISDKDTIESVQFEGLGLLPLKSLRDMNESIRMYCSDEVIWMSNAINEGKK